VGREMGGVGCAGFRMRPPNSRFGCECIDALTVVERGVGMAG
jgi:hypothetical protein